MQITGQNCRPSHQKCVITKNINQKEHAQPAFAGGHGFSGITAFRSGKGKQLVYFMPKNLSTDLRASLKFLHGKYDLPDNRTLEILPPKPGIWNKLKSLFQTSFMLTKNQQFTYGDRVQNEPLETKFSLRQSLLSLNGLGQRIDVESVTQHCSTMGIDGVKPAHYQTDDPNAEINAYKAIKDLVTNYGIHTKEKGK